MSTASIKIALFDLGGVLVDVADLGPLRELAKIDTEADFWEQWLAGNWVRRFESGQCSPEEFAVGFIDEWHLGVDPKAFLDAFANWPGDILPGATELVLAARKSVQVGCLSNMNALHWERRLSWRPIVNAFDFCFLSFQLGMVKPDRETFEHVANTLKIPTGHILFLDDNALNVEAAEEAGFAARCVRGVQEATDALLSNGIVI